MKAFCFSLQRLLETKESMEKERQRVVAHAIRALEREQSMLAFQRAEVARAEAWRAPGEGDVRVPELVLHSQYLGHLRAEAVKGERRVAACQCTLARRQAELQQAARERGSLERLRDHEHRDWLQEFKRMEQRQMDESASHQDLHERRVAALQGRSRAA
jgi:flagellar export protein FliJ